jgi:hypothetical protein
VVLKLTKTVNLNNLKFLINRHPSNHSPPQQVFVEFFGVKKNAKYA